MPRSPWDQAHTCGTLVTAPAWPAHPAWLSQFLRVLGTRIETVTATIGPALVLLSRSVDCAECKLSWNHRYRIAQDRIRRQQPQNPPIERSQSSLTPDRQIEQHGIRQLAMSHHASANLRRGYP